MYWEKEKNRFKCIYFEKEMRNPVIVLKKFGMDRAQKFGILSQQLIRRMSNIIEGVGEKEEKLRVMDEHTKQF